MGDPLLPPGLRRRRIIERPRLLKALDESPARIKLLIAGPGYGKTTLLEQWAAQSLSESRWLRVRQRHNDVAVFAVDLCATLDRELAERALDLLRVSTDPASDVETLVSLLAQDLRSAGQGDGSAIIIDDYHLIAEGRPADCFLGLLASEAHLPFVIASRVRPGWISRRAVLYGEVLEISQSALAMTSDETAALLSRGRSSAVSGLSALANGWPAVIGMAAVASESDEQDNDELPDALYEYFAEEVYRELDSGVAQGLQTLALLPTVDTEVAVGVLGSDFERVRDVGTSLGILDVRGEHFEFHPLALAFLERRLRDRRKTSGEIAQRALQIYERRGDWDACLSLCRAYGLRDDYLRLIDRCAADLLATSRIASLETWVDAGRDWGLADRRLALAQAEVDLCQGRYLAALMRTREAEAEDGDKSDLRLHFLAAKAAHAGSLEEEALRQYETARALAVLEADRREASWGMLMCLAALERPEALELLSGLEAETLKDSDARDQVRMADKRLSVGFRFGRVEHLADAHRVAELVPSIDDPIVRCSFRSMYSWALLLGAYYSDAAVQAQHLIEDATEFRIHYALTYGHATHAAALAGGRRFDDALESAERAHAAAVSTRDDNGIQNAYSIRMRVLTQSGSAAEACATEPPDLSRALPSMRGEVWASRAVALATLGRVEQAMEAATAAAGFTTGVEARLLSAVASVLVALKTRSSGLHEECGRLLEEAFSSGAVDPVVTGYRANLDLIAALVSDPARRDRAVFLLRRAGDEALVSEVVAHSSELVNPVSTLSAREREIYDLLCQGMKNAQIARLLFISEGTVKVHVQHVFDKLGIRSRTALALNAARRVLPNADSGANVR